MFCYYYCCQSKEQSKKKKQFAFRGQSLTIDSGVGRAGREDGADKFIILNGTYWTTIPVSVHRPLAWQHTCHV